MEGRYEYDNPNEKVRDEKELSEFFLAKREEIIQKGNHFVTNIKTTLNSLMVSSDPSE